MIVSMASVISTSTVSAAHTQSATISQTLLPPTTAKVLTITVTNNGSDAIDNVRIVLPTGFTAVGPTSVVLANDNAVELADNENIVVIPAGTKLKITGAITVSLPANTVLIKPSGDNIRVENAAGTSTENRILLENARIYKATAQNLVGLVAGDNVNSHEARTVWLQENDVIMVTQTTVLSVVGGKMMLPADATVKVHDDVNVTGLTTGDNVDLIAALSGEVVTTTNWILEGAVSTRVGIDTHTLVAGAWLNLSVDNGIVLPAGSKVALSGDTTVMLYENTQVTRSTPENIWTPSAENRPQNWMQTTSGNTLEWVGIGDNRLAAGASLAIPLYATSPGTTGSYSTFVRATDTADTTMITELVVTVDATAPTVTVQISPSTVKGSTQVAIKVVASEALAKLDNVMVCENNGENTRITLTSADGGVNWTGTYTTSDNTQRDGTASVWVVAAQTEDMAGNKLASNYENTFTVDRAAPPKPNLAGFTSWIADSANTPGAGIQTSTASWLIEGTAQDNYWQALSAREGMTVKIRVGTTVYTFSPSSSGYFYQTVTLSQGKQEVGVQYVDKAGNAGLENVENVTLDSVAPAISITTPSSAYSKDNTPLIVVSISDATLGVENTAYTNTTKSGYTVQLRRNDNSIAATLTPMTAIPGPFTSGIFENQWPTDNALPDNVYKVYAIAGDNLENAVVIFSFTIDTVAPSAPASLVGSLVGTGTIASPTSTTSSAFTLTGTAEANSSIKVYVTTDGGVTWTELTTAEATASATGAWSTSVSLTGSAGSTTGLKVTATDAASNESASTAYGYFKYTPASASSLAGSVTGGVSAAAATVTTSSSVAITGTASPNATITVYTTIDGGVTWTVYGDVTASASGAWTTTVALTEFAGDALGIAVTASDEASNESARALYGYLLYDPNAPAVELTAPISGTSTDQSSVEVAGTVSKDAWESYADITLTLQVGTGSVVVPVSSDGTFVYSVALSEGLNTILVRASDGVNVGAPASVAVTRTVTQWATYAIIVVIVALVLAAIAIFRKR